MLGGRNTATEKNGKNETKRNVHKSLPQSMVGEKLLVFNTLGLLLELSNLFWSHATGDQAVCLGSPMPPKRGKVKDISLPLPSSL